MGTLRKVKGVHPLMDKGFRLLWYICMGEVQLKEALEQGYTNFGHSLEILEQMRLELTITEAEHQAILTELGVESAELLDPDKQYSREDWLRWLD
jgi:hypothetical protein